jgi:hypothetical protein
MGSMYNKKPSKLHTLYLYETCTVQGCYHHQYVHSIIILLILDDRTVRFCFVRSPSLIYFFRLWPLAPTNSTMVGHLVLSIVYMYVSVVACYTGSP